MRYRLEDGQLFDRARREAQQLLESLKGPTALILADVVPRAPLSTLSDDRATLRQALQEAEPLEGQSALEDAVTRYSAGVAQADDMTFIAFGVA